MGDGAAAREPAADQEHAQHLRPHHQQRTQRRAEITQPLQHRLSIGAVSVGLPLRLDRRLRMGRLRGGDLVRHQQHQRAQQQHQPDRRQVGQHAHHRQPGTRCFAEGQQQERQQRVDDQDVAGPQQQRMHQADAQQAEAATQVEAGEIAPGNLGALRHHREAGAEQQREQGEELALHEDVDEGIRPAVHALPVRIYATGGQVQRADEGLHVHQQDAQQRHSTQDIERGDALVRRDGLESGVGHVRGSPWMDRRLEHAAIPTVRGAGNETARTGRAVRCEIAGRAISDGGHRRRARGRAALLLRWPRGLPRSPRRSAGPCRPSGGSDRRRPRSCRPFRR